jgi:hypothetical protein
MATTFAFPSSYENGREAFELTIMVQFLEVNSERIKEWVKTEPEGYASSYLQDLEVVLSRGTETVLEVSTSVLFTVLLFL